MISRYQNVPQQLSPLSTLCMRFGLIQRIGCETGTCVDNLRTDGIRRCTTFSRPSATALAQMRTQRVCLLRTRGIPAYKVSSVNGILHSARCFGSRAGSSQDFRPSASTPQLTCTKHKIVKRRAIRHDQHTRSPNNDSLVHNDRNFIPRTRDHFLSAFC
jgi:hypothetical protein